MLPADTSGLVEQPLRSGAVNQSSSCGQSSTNSSNTRIRLDRTLLPGTCRQIQAR
jgi:hypothetical protein